MPEIEEPELLWHSLCLYEEEQMKIVYYEKDLDGFVCNNY
jgi:hypothetical protein